MKKLNGYILLIILTLMVGNVVALAQYKTNHVYDDLYDSETVAAFKAHVTSIASDKTLGRKAGSEGEKIAADYMASMLKKYNVELLSGKEGEIFGIKSENGDTICSRNVIGYIQGYDKKLKDEYIVIGARMDNLGAGEITIDGETKPVIYNGANGNASGMAMLLELAKKIRTNSILFRRSIVFVGFGASKISCAGSWYFLNKSVWNSSKIAAMIDLDALGTGYYDFYAFTCGNDDMNSIIYSLENSLEPVRPKLVAQDPYPSDNMAFYSAEIPSVHFTTGKYPEYDTAKDVASILDYEGMERELEYIYDYTLELANGKLPAFRTITKPEKKAASDENNGLYGYYDCDIPPLFLGSSDMRTFMAKWVYKYLKYPQEAIDKGIRGKVMIDFIVEKNGKVSNVRVAKSVDPILDEQAVKVISASPKWRSGRVGGKKIRTMITIPVEFRLESKTKRRGLKLKKY